MCPNFCFAFALIPSDQKGGKEAIAGVLQQKSARFSSDPGRVQVFDLAEINAEVKVSYPAIRPSLPLPQILQHKPASADRGGKLQLPLGSEHPR